MTSRTRSSFTAVQFFLAALFLLSVLTPEQADAPGYKKIAVPAFVESDAEFALCCNPVVTPELECHATYLPLILRAVSLPALTVSGNFYRGPPSFSSAL